MVTKPGKFSPKALSFAATAVFCILPFGITFLFIVLSARFLSPHTVLSQETGSFFQSLAELSVIVDRDSVKHGSDEQIADDIEKLKRLSQTLRDSSLDNVVLTEKSEELIEISGRLEDSKRYIEDRKKLEKVVSELSKEAGSVREALSRLMAVNWDGMTRLLLGILWISLLAGGLVYLFKFPAVLRVLSGFLKLIRGVKGFGVELSFQEKDSRNEEIHMMFQKVFSEMRQQVNSEVALFVQRKRLEDLIERAVADIKQKLSEITKGSLDNTDYRCTIHVPDPLFQEFYYQMLDYIPRGGGRKGRCFPIYFGIAGRVWRSEEAGILHLEAGEKDTDQLVMEWGMTKKQAAIVTRAGERGYLCVPLKDKGQQVGIFYLDTDEPDALRPAEKTGKLDITAIVENTCEELGITEALSKFWEEIGGNAPLIQINDPYGS